MGGSIQIFDDILKADQNLKVDVKCNRGQTALHYAIRERKVDMSIYLISHFAELLSSIKIDTGQRPEIHRDTKKQITPRFEPIHWIAWIGNLQILETLKRKNGKTSFDMAKTTINELNILHIACLANENDFCKHVMKNETQIDIDITDNCGWNVAHYAARANNSAFFKILKQFKKENLIEIRTKCKKTTLHIACEYASEKVVDYLLENHKTLLDKTDELKWNALHYATKGGNLSILKKIIHNGLNVGSLTNEEKTLLHVACIHKQVDICRYVAEKFVKTNQSALINKKTTNYGWLAAHYLGVERKGNGREEAILDILYDYKMDLKDETDDGHSILDIALEHFNEGLVNYILSAKYIEAMDISKQKLQKAERDARNEEIKASLRRALETFKWH
ncbi:putative ankyrin repeat protein RF_0381 [Saccostrea echinata]|uniref:putative ankyrin repeat protein RF_0381 n=1 Tax=Saccostrea echinata TaxID=191078 RepID=UPI002A83AC0A|nr:putative ankyrin repeat protein RF_0381 [Saccostrea echinata]